MRREHAVHLIRHYMEAWVHQDLERCLLGLSDDIAVIECDGSLYTGKEQVRCWFTEWHKMPINGRVTEWTVDSLVVDEECSRAAVEWRFSCVCFGEASTFRGASVFTFQTIRFCVFMSIKRASHKPLLEPESAEVAGQAFWIGALGH